MRRPGTFVVLAGVVSAFGTGCFGAREEVSEGSLGSVAEAYTLRRRELQVNSFGKKGCFLVDDVSIR